MRFPLALLAFFLTLTACAGRWGLDTATTSDPAVALLRVSENGEKAGTCTVFKVGSDLVMTAGHCCEKDDPAVIRTYVAEGPHAIAGASFEPIRIDSKNDVCVMKGKLRGAALSLAKHDPQVGSHVWTAGYPKGIFLISSGYWAGRDDDGEAIASVAVWGGASGSPILTPDNEVVGILRAYYPPMSNMSVVAPIEHLRTSLLIARALEPSFTGM